jgi:phosphotriesterase-related protein
VLRLRHIPAGLLALGAALSAGEEPRPSPKAGDDEGSIVTVRGRIPARDLGKALPHEHVLCDFGGAEGAEKRKADPAAVVDLVKPRLLELKERGFRAFVDATPAWIGRDVRILERLAAETGLHIITNTGWYGAAGDKFLPRAAFDESADELAARWIAEHRDGIDGSGIRPGFIKIGVDPGPLSDVDRKLVRAAARAHLATGLTIACHTGEEKAALEVLETVRSEKASPEALVVVHADGIARSEARLQLAEGGAWLEYDGVGGRPIEEHVRLVLELSERRLLHRLLLSHDAGWYSVGAADGGKAKLRPYTAIPDRLVPALRKAGLSEEALEKVLADNPRRAFAIKVRKAGPGP